MDRLSTEKRSQLMAAVRREHTKPELIVRKALHRMGARFRLHPAQLPGRPDIVLPGRNLCIFVHGCFWHRHSQCRLASTPSSNQEFWTSKFIANVARDRRNEDALKHLGWEVISIWQCETRDVASLTRRISAVLSEHPYQRHSSRKR